MVMEAKPLKVNRIAETNGSARATILCNAAKLAPAPGLAVSRGSAGSAV
jgi:hypothetical protein